MDHKVCVQLISSLCNVNAGEDKGPKIEQLVSVEESRLRSYILYLCRIDTNKHWSHNQVAIILLLCSYEGKFFVQILTSILIIILFWKGGCKKRVIFPCQADWDVMEGYLFEVLNSI